MTTQQAFALGLQHHQAGRLADAEALYRQILAEQPGHAEALHLLGVIAHQVGRHDLAVEMIQHAITIAPNNPIAHCHLGEALDAQGQIDEAIASYRRALQFQPDYPEALVKPVTFPACRRPPSIGRTGSQAMGNTGGGAHELNWWRRLSGAPPRSFGAGPGRRRKG